jgi:hypothetical protein
MNNQKVVWKGTITSVQPRIRLTRSFDQRSHTYQGYLLRLTGIMNGKECEFLVGIGKSAHEKHRFRVGDVASGESHLVENRQTEAADIYKTSKLVVLKPSDLQESTAPPWTGVAPGLQTYRERGHRRLDTVTYESKCFACIWGCQMSVEMIIDQWNPQKRRHRFETFCYGPKSSSYYKAGPTRKVPGRHGMIWEEEDWVDEDAVSPLRHRRLGILLK